MLRIHPHQSRAARGSLLLALACSAPVTDAAGNIHQGSATLTLDPLAFGTLPRAQTIVTHFSGADTDGRGVGSDGSDPHSLVALTQVDDTEVTDHRLTFSLFGSTIPASQSSGEGRNPVATDFSYAGSLDGVSGSIGLQGGFGTDLIGRDPLVFVYGDFGLVRDGSTNRWAVTQGFGFSGPLFDIENLAETTTANGFTVSGMLVLDGGTSANFYAGGPNFDSSGLVMGEISFTVTAVPVPAAAWLFGAGLLGLLAAGRRHRP